MTEDDKDEIPMIKREVAPFGADEVIEILDEDENKNQGVDDKIKCPTYFSWYFESIKVNKERLLAVRNIPTIIVDSEIITVNDDDDCVVDTHASNNVGATTETIEDKIPPLCESLQNVAMDNIESVPSINNNVPM